MAQVFPNGEEEGVETTANMITLTATAHDYWNKGYFALKPVSLSEDKKTLQIQFFWQRQHPNVKPYMSLLEFPPSTRDISDPGDCFLTRREPVEGGPATISLLRSGMIITMRTDDPEARPLPSMALLEMQWYLQRIMGIAGAADLEDLDESDESDD